MLLTRRLVRPGNPVVASSPSLKLISAPLNMGILVELACLFLATQASIAVIVPAPCSDGLPPYSPPTPTWGTITTTIIAPPGSPTPTTITLTPPTLTTTTLIPLRTPTTSTLCVSSTLACATICAIGCPPGQIVTGTKCPFCTCAKPTPLCSPTTTAPPPVITTPVPVPTESSTCVTSTLSCATNCAIGCLPPLVLTGTACGFCSCALPTPLCTATPLTK
ncbi:hypothetical protein DFP72DRAFT_921372 [Ephemerocybe angulata]|uniref:Uncharacterized protein n=1 Tax=Ephemerocybe angulata TaxID=980116 RepID=A0A8H6HGZ2_9AGAR|nr:hypothetical protein DFP72DRAFT_921372 [Tulosesus angulatus]